MKTEHVIEIICISVITVCVLSLAKKLGEQRTMKESLEGYRAIAIYETNSIGEIKIKNVEWKKP